MSEEKKASLYKKELWYEANKEVRRFCVVALGSYVSFSLLIIVRL